MILGYIADDRMFVVLDRFFNEDITELAKELSEEERGKLKEASEMNRTAGIAMTNEICRKYRREGRFFDEILKEGEWHDRSEPGKKSAL